MQIARQHSRQPQSAAVIDRGSSLARRLIFHAPLHPQWGMLDLVTGRPGTRTGLAARAGGTLGQLPLFGTSSYIDFAAPPSFDGAQPFTISWVQEPRSGTGNSAVLDVRPPIGSSNSFLIYESATDTAYQLCIGPRDGGGAGRQANFAVGLTSNNTPDRYVLVAPSGIATSTAQYVLFRNGVRLTSGTSSPFGAATPTGLRIGALLSSGTDPFEGALGGISIWQRALTDAECIVMSTRPSAIYAPHRLPPFGGVGAAGSTTTINAGVGAAVAAGHPASVVLTTRVAAGIGAAAAAGHPALLALHTSIAAGVASAAAAGHPAQLALHTTVAAGVGAAVAAGHPATVNVQTGTTINAGVGAAVAAGHPATILVYETTTINAGVGAATAAGHQATVAAHTVVAAGVGAATAAGHPAALALHTAVQAGVGAAVAAGHPATIVTAQATTINAGVGAATAQGHPATINVAGEVPQAQTSRGYRGNPRDLRDPWLDAAAEGQVRDKWDAIEKARKPFEKPFEKPDDDTPAAEAAPIPTVPPAPPAAAAPVKASAPPPAPTSPPAAAAVLPEIPDAVEVLAAQTIERAKRQATEETLLVLLAMVV